MCVTKLVEGIDKREYEHSTSILITIQYKRHLYSQNKNTE
jgi:hypothetical protein